MGILVSIFSSIPSDSDDHAQTNTGRGQSPPNYIALPPPFFAPSSLPSSSPSRGVDDPFLSPMYSPGLEMYHTAPSTPIASPLIEVPSLAAAHQRATESSVANLHVSMPPGSPQKSTDDLPVEDAFPAGEIPIDLVDDEGLSALEKIYLFACSQSVFHRLYIVHALPEFLEQVTPQEAIEYVLPLVPCLAMDEDERVKEALVAELVPVIWWFFTHCQVIPDDLSLEETVYSSSTSTISVQAFTPILGTLLLNSKVGGAARYVVVNILARMRKLNNRESGNAPPASTSPSSEPEESPEDIPVGLFGWQERLMFEQELLQQVVIGMGKLDVVDTEDDVDLYGSHARQDPAEGNWPRHSGDNIVQVTTLDQEARGEPRVTSPTDPEKVQSASGNVNPYFPVSLPYPPLSPGSSNSSTPSSVTDTSSSSSSSSSSPAVLSEGAESPSSNASDTPPSAPRSKPDQQSFRDASSPLQLSNVSSAQELPQTEIQSTAQSPTETRQSIFHPSRTSSDAGTDEHGGTEGTDEGEGDQASVGRLSSMSLMAAVTANGGCVDENTQRAFVREVERVSHDPVYWVRREASYALGALAKVVPDELVALSLIPLFDNLRRDSQWHVRHSALYALPGILSRLSPAKRRALALDTIIPLSTDEAQPVRTGVLESLGEVMYTFHEDDTGPPEELVQLFLGRREDRRVRDGQQAAQARDQVISSLFGRPQPPRAASSSSQTRTDSPLTSFYTDPARPLICAFNYPAVALTLGRARWGELRETYLEIADNKQASVRRTLAASLGELAKVIGEENAERDLVGVWWKVVRSEEEEVREKALECMEMFVAALVQQPRIAIVSGLLTIWEEGVFRGWRERKGIASSLPGLAGLVGHNVPAVLRGLLRKALEDAVAAVREAAISALPRLWRMFSEQQAELAQLRENVQTLSQSGLYRQRMTFVACVQCLVVDGPDNQPFITAEDDLWSAISHLADDTVVGVRIGIARLARVASERYQNGHQQSLRNLIRHLSLDSSHDVRAYVANSLNAAPAPQLAGATSAEVTGIRPPRRASFATFSRPPSQASLRMFPAPSFSDVFDEEIRRGLTRSATGDFRSDSLSTSALSPALDDFTRTGRENLGSAELFSESDSKRAITVPG
ncbi:armadillo-type protein [Mycena sanguinolenta]|nr:armadillo-type protein [Mycena sanguinolenta]